MYEGVEDHCKIFGKLKRVLQYLKETLNMPSVLDADSMLKLMI